MKINVNSSNIKSVDWDAKTLEVDFHRGATYRYSEVPEEVFNQLINAQSVGKYFNGNIAKHYSSERIK